MRPRKAGLVGAGVIGGGWAARLLLNGVDVALYDPDPEAPRKVEAMVANARRALSRLIDAPKPAEGRLRFVGSPEEAAEGADLVQESAPEREDLKVTLLARAARAAPEDAIIASSTSGLLPSRLQAEMAGPERFTVAHPFNPVYLMPLVELCGGAATAPATIERAADLYRALGMHPLHVRHEVDGFIADRLMEALWREALWLVHDEVATVEEIDDALRYGPGLRWAFMGTFLIYRIAGGEAGMRHFMAQFGPALKWPWTRLTDVPELTDALLDRLAAQSDAQAAKEPVGADLRALERLRDDCLVAVLRALEGQRYGAGADLAAHAAQLRQAAPAERTGITSFSARVPEAWLDHNGHMTEHRYLDAFGQATDRLLETVGLDSAAIAAGRSAYTVETHLRHLAEAKAGEAIEVTTRILGADAKRLHIFHEMVRQPDGTTLATAEQMLIHVDRRIGRAAPAEDAVAARIVALMEQHRRGGLPEGAGRRIAMPETR